MKITAQDLLGLKVIDTIVQEPVGAAHRDREAVFKATGDAIAKALAEFDGKSGEEITTDEHGRVFVLFHWDRYGKADETSSLPVRVSQNWAGKRWVNSCKPPRSAALCMR
jgi:hypothetical protein